MLAASEHKRAKQLFANHGYPQYHVFLTAAKVIEEIMQLPRDEQSRVVEFAFELARKRQLSPDELTELAERMANSQDPSGVERLKAQIMRGFYGD